ncbi:hypothetical protein EVAR_94691_1 [Eumeta japonica]|uniref:Uncharacterized protein n=1 Tax=Eumeta variegata TaxID=151549 RepID=A0A4C1UVJ9_EUMVA|nr:hypothetical protein EVAR_94691_1 [Eumeta japonica]
MLVGEQSRAPRVVAGLRKLRPQLTPAPPPPPPDPDLRISGLVDQDLEDTLGSNAPPYSRVARRKIMDSSFWDSKGVVMIEYLDRGATVTSSLHAGQIITSENSKETTRKTSTNCSQVFGDDVDVDDNEQRWLNDYPLSHRRSSSSSSTHWLKAVEGWILATRNRLNSFQLVDHDCYQPRAATGQHKEAQALGPNLKHNDCESCCYRYCKCDVTSHLLFLARTYSDVSYCKLRTRRTDASAKTNLESNKKKKPDKCDFDSCGEGSVR